MTIQATHFIGGDDLADWFREHGFNVNDVVDATISLNYQPAGTFIGRQGVVAAFLDITFYKKDWAGHHILDGDQIATGNASIPLRSLPPLTEAPP